MKDTVYENLAEVQLVSLFGKGTASNEAIKKEWKRRNGLPFPYSTDCTGALYNRITGHHVPDDEADPLILKQAEQLREKARKRRERMGLG